MLAGANRDPDAFEHPDALMLDRSPNQHLAFSNGIHFCLGAMLARMEGQEAFPLLLEKAPNLQRANDELVYRPNMTLRGLAELQVIGLTSRGDRRARLPANHGVVALVHGGFWRATYGPELMDKCARDLTGARLRRLATWRTGGSANPAEVGPAPATTLSRDCARSPNCTVP